MTDTSVDLCGFSLKNPVMTASGTFGYGVEFEPFGDLAGLGAIVVKGLSLEPREGNPTPRIVETPCGMLNAIGLQNIGLRAFVEKKLPLLPHAEVPVIANIYGSAVSDYARISEYLSGIDGVAAMEVNISCPNVHAGGLLFGQDPVQAGTLVREVVSRAGNKPVIVKLTPNVTDVCRIARAAQDAGAHALSLINTLSGMAVDLEKRRPMLANVIGGLSGPAIKPVAMRCVYQVCRAVEIPVIGIGGIMNARDILEFILVGACAVQVGTASFTRPDTVFRIVRELPELMQSLGIESLKDFRGTLSA